MLEFTTQLDYLRDVQRTFGSGSDRIDMLGVFSKILFVALPIIVAMLLWNYRHAIGFTIARFVARLLSLRGRRIVQNYLVKKGVVLEIYSYSNKGPGRLLGMAQVSEVIKGKMQLKFLDVKPTGLNLKNARVICFTKPFTYSGSKINAFITYIGDVKKQGATIRKMSLLTPIRYQFVIRRKHKRKRVTREGAVRIKVWDIAKRRTFRMVRPDLQTVNNPARYGKKTRLVAENISAGGIRLLILNPSGRLPSLSAGHQLIMRVSIWSPKNKKYAYFTVVGTIRSRFKGKGGAIGLGIQFTAEGTKAGGQYQWKSLHGEMKALAQFLEMAADWEQRGR